MIIIIALIAFAVPLLLRDILEILQVLMAIIWVILLADMPNTFQTSSFEFTAQRILFLAMPMWIFGSFIALSMRSVRVNEFYEELVEEQQRKSDGLVIDYQTSKAEENECPICFSKRQENQSECTNCGHIYE